MLEKDKVMAKSHKKPDESNGSGNDTTVKEEVIAENRKQVITSNDFQNDSSSKVKEKTLILFKGRAKKNVDETISSPDRYVSRFHYTTKNMYTCLELCSHCKNPTLSAFRGAVIDSALDYLEGKRVLIDQKNDPINIFKYITYLLAIAAITYFLLYPVLSAFMM